MDKTPVDEKIADAEILNAPDPSVQPDEGPAGGGRKQLRGRVETRIAELEAALADPNADALNQARAQAIISLLRGVKELVGGGWEHVGALEAKQLSSWLEASANLTATGPEPPTAKAEAAAPPLGPTPTPAT